MHELIIRAIEQGGLLGIFLLMAVENIFPPIPSEVIMGLGGVAVSRGTIDFWPLMIVGTIGSTAGNYVWYWLGDHWGRTRLEPFVNRWARWLTMEWEDVERAQRFFQRHGPWVVFVFRFSRIWGSGGSSALLLPGRSSGTSCWSKAGGGWRYGSPNRRRCSAGSRLACSG
jgi:membrane protein DedA with SNARE-associated domain